MFPRRPAPELQVLSWLNSEPMTLSQLKRKVVMIDFWTFSCINCIRTLPHMRRVWKKFKDHPFVMIGVHSPEFEFEKDMTNIKKAIIRHGLEYPIAIDSDFSTWKAYENRYWPAQYFIDKDGVIRHVHVGEGGELEIEAWIVRLLKEMGDEVELGHVEESIEGHDFRMSHETYCGALRNRGIGNDEECEALKACNYNDEGPHEVETIYLQGSWSQDMQYLEHEEGEGHISLMYQANEVFVVMSSDSPTEVEVRLDGSPLTKEMSGQDIFFRDGQSYLSVDRNDMFYLVKASEFGGHELRLLVKEKGLKIYAFTFG